VAILLLALSIKAILAFGPILVSSAIQTWLLSSPIDRRATLVARFVVTVGAGAFGGALLFIVLGVFAEVSVRTLPVVVASGLMAGVLVIALATVAQSSLTMAAQIQRTLRVVVRADIISIGIVLLVAPSQTTSRGLTVDNWIVPACALVAAVLLTCVAFRRLGQFGRAALINGTQLADAATAAATWLDPTLLSATVVSRKTRAIGRVRSEHLHGSRTVVLLRAEWIRLRRMSLEVSVWAGLMVLPYVAKEILPFGAVAPVHLVSAFLATERLAGGLRTVARSEFLRRALGGTDLQLRLVHLIMPAVGTVVWCVATVFALPAHAFLCAAVSAFGAIAVTYRMATRQAMDYSSPLLDTPFGLVPVNIVRQVVRGPALLAILVLVQFVIAS
jgi:hypothetical protein